MASGHREHALRPEQAGDALAVGEAAVSHGLDGLLQAQLMHFEELAVVEGMTDMDSPRAKKISMRSSE
jgi:hypothetical protein